MKVEVNTAAFADAVAWTTSVIDARPANPILAGVKLEAQDGTMQLSVFTYEISARDHVEAGIDEAGTVVVLGKLLANISKSLPAEKTYLDANETTMTITSGAASFTLQLMPESEYPDLPELPQQLGQVDAQTFMQTVNQAAIAVARDENRPVLTGVHMRFNGDEVTLSSTDRFRLARASFHWTPQDEQLETTALVRGAYLTKIARSMDERENVTIYLDAENPSLIGIENAGRVSTVQLIDGEFPSVDRLYADSYPIQAVINKTDLLEAAKRVSLVAERNAPIRMVFTEQQVLLTAGGIDEASAKQTLPVDLDGEDITVAFNPAYLRDGLSVITEPYIRMKMTTAVKPVEFNGQQEQDSEESMNYRYLLVPMRFNV